MHRLQWVGFKSWLQLHGHQINNVILVSVLEDIQEDFNRLQATIHAGFPCDIQSLQRILQRRQRPAKSVLEHLPGDGGGASEFCASNQGR